MPATDDEIKEKYLERAIRELNQLTHDLQDCPHCPRGKLMPVLGSGHPQADVFMLKQAPAAAEIEEGVAFYGRAGNALMKSFKRLGIDPLVVYGTLCVKCPIAEPDLAADQCLRRVVEEIAIVQPKIVVVMGEPALRVLNGFEMPLSRPIEAREVVIATNGYTGDVTPTLKRRLVPVASHIIATEELPEDLVKSLIPKGRVVSDTKRVLCYYRRSPDDKRVIFGGRARFTQVTPEVSAPVLHGYMLERWPQLKGTKVTHAWTGNVAFAFDFLPHMGQEQGMHYLMACNGSGVAMMSYLGYQTARKIAGGSNAPINAFDGQDFPTVPFYSGNPWFLPMVGGWYRTRDWWDRLTA